MMLRWLVMLAIFVAPLCAAAADYYTKENLLKFAAFLDEEGEYDRAIGEYLRDLGANGDTTAKDSLYYRIAIDYIKLSKPAAARAYCVHILGDSAPEPLAAKSRCLYAYSYYLEAKYDSLMTAMGLPPEAGKENNWRHRLVQIRLAALLKQYRWNDAVTEVEKTLGSPEARNDSIVQFL
jgi:hypothetical protein